MAIPPLNSQGELPPGEHAATFDEIEATFGHESPRREELIEKFKLAVQNFGQAGVERVWVNGSFTTDKVAPNDIDGCWEWNSTVDLSILDAVFLNKSRAPMKAKYGVDFFIAHVVEAGSGLPFPKFFQKNRNGDPKGILVLEVS